jgi:hypothetical protein
VRSSQRSRERRRPTAHALKGPRHGDIKGSPIGVEADKFVRDICQSELRSFESSVYGPTLWACLPKL